ncbi:MAG: glycosyltransferase family 2 protein [Spartobacteria bacterium]|nr:glycosyltransferase family 2 protein [Spartobacteria bacterium]
MHGVCRADDPMVSVVIPNYNGMHWLTPCLEALSRQSCPAFEIIVVDNGSVDESAALLQRDFPQVQLILSPCNEGFAAAVNKGIAASDAKYVVLLNNDTVPEKDWLRSLVEAAEAAPERTAAFASCMLMMDKPDCMDNAGDIFSWQGSAVKRGYGCTRARYQDEASVLSVCAGAALYRREVLARVGGFAEYFFAYLEDVDLGLRLRLAGYECVYVPDAKICHAGHGSSIPTDFYVRLITANRLHVFFRNIPTRLIFRHLLSILYGQVYYFIMYRHSLSSLKGYISFCRNMRLSLRQRKSMHAMRVLTLAEVDLLLEKNFPEPSLYQSLVKGVKRVKRRVFA